MTQPDLSPDPIEAAAEALVEAMGGVDWNEATDEQWAAHCRNGAVAALTASGLLDVEQERDRPTDDELIAALKMLRPEHLYCEDPWYSCPKAPDGSIDPASGDECTCGAEVKQAIVDQLLAALAPEGETND